MELWIKLHTLCCRLVGVLSSSQALAGRAPADDEQEIASNLHRLSNVTSAGDLAVNHAGGLHLESVLAFRKLAFSNLVRVCRMQDCPVVVGSHSMTGIVCMEAAPSQHSYRILQAVACRFSRHGQAACDWHCLQKDWVFGPNVWTCHRKIWCKSHQVGFPTLWSV